MPSQLFFNVVSALIFAVGGLLLLLVYDDAAIGLRILFGFLSAFGIAELIYLVWATLRKRSAGGSSEGGDEED